MFIGIGKLEKLTGKPGEVLGKIPSYEEPASEVRRVVEEAEKGVRPGGILLGETEE